MKYLPCIVLLLGACIKADPPTGKQATARWQILIANPMGISLIRYYDREMGVVCYATGRADGGVNCVNVGTNMRPAEKP